MYALVGRLPTVSTSNLSAGRPDVAEPREVYGCRRGCDLPGVLCDMQRVLCRATPGTPQHRGVGIDGDASGLTMDATHGAPVWDQQSLSLSLRIYIYTYIYTYVYIYINCICIIYLHLQVHACPGNQNALLSDVLFNFPGVKTDGIYISFLVNSPSWLPLFREDINALLSSPFDLMQRILGGNAEILGWWCCSHHLESPDGRKDLLVRLRRTIVELECRTDLGIRLRQHPFKTSRPKVMTIQNTQISCFHEKNTSPNLARVLAALFFGSPIPTFFFLWSCCPPHLWYAMSQGGTLSTTLDLRWDAETASSMWTMLDMCYAIMCIYIYIHIHT